MNDPTAFWLDDRGLAQPGAERLAELVEAHLGEFDGVWGDIAPVAFACAAWRVATPPIADPGLVRRHRRVLSARCERNSWDGSLKGHIAIAAPLPAALSVSRTWWRDRGWQQWPQLFGQFVEPAEADLAKVPFIRPVLHLDVPIPLHDLPPAPERPGRHVAGIAQRALLVLTRELDRLVGPVLAPLDADGPPRT
jgi:hypothetical protein